MATKTPAKKTAAPKTEVAVRKPTSGAVVSIQEQLKAQAAAMNERIQPGTGNKIRLAKGKFVLPDGTETSEPLELVIVDFLAVNKFYEGAFDSKNPAPPACFAIGSNPRALVPSDNSPNKQASECSGCPMNEFGSAGTGKACKNTRVLAVLPPDADADTDMWTLEVSPTGLKGFDGYVAGVTRMFQLPPVGVVTTVALDPSVDYPKLMFSNPQPNANLEVCFGRQGEARDLLAVEPDVSGYQPIKAPVRRAAAGRR